MAEITVIIPTCDRPDMLNRAISSAASQADVDLEIIVVNDGQDIPASHVEAWRESGKSINMIKNQHLYSGVSCSRNHGAFHASSPLIAFLDDDDYWDSSFLSVMKAIHDTQDIDMSAASFWNDYGGVIKPGKTAPETLNLYDFMEKNLGITGSNFVIRKEFFDQVGGFDEALPTSNDMDFVVQFIKQNGKYKHSQDRLVYFVQHKGDRLTNINRRKIKGTLRFYNKYKREMPTHIKKRRLSKIYLRFWEYEKNSSTKRPIVTFMKYVPKAFLYNPNFFIRLILKKFYIKSQIVLNMLKIIIKQFKE